MNRILILVVLVAISSTSCSNDTYTCTCTQGDKEVASFQLEMDKKSAGFECQQKAMKFSGPEYDGTTCAVNE